MESPKKQYCNCLYYSANALARMITKIADEEFSITGLSSSYAFVLLTVAGKPDLQIGEIANIMQLTPSTVTRLIEKMETKGLVTRTHEGRSTFVSLTEKGGDIIPKVRNAWAKLYQRYTVLLGEKESQALTAMISGATEKLEL